MYVKAPSAVIETVPPFSVVQSNGASTSAQPPMPTTESTAPGSGSTSAVAPGAPPWMTPLAASMTSGTLPMASYVSSSASGDVWREPGTSVVPASNDGIVNV